MVRQMDWHYLHISHPCFIQLQFKADRCRHKENLPNGF